MKTTLRIVGIIALSVIFYIDGDHPVEYIVAFVGLLSLVFWGIPAAVCWIFGLNKTKEDGIIYIDTMSEESVGMKLHIYDPNTVIDKAELVIKVDIPEGIFKEDENEKVEIKK